MVDHAAIGRKSKRKGAAGERELANLLKDYGYDCRRGRQYDGAGAADVIGLDGIHIEVKRVERLNLSAALEQSRRDAKGMEIPIVCHRKNREGWQVTMGLEEFLLMYRLYQEALNEK